MNNPIYKLTAIANSVIVLMDRIKNSDDDYIVQADVDSVRVDLYELHDPAVTYTTSDGDDVTTTRLPVDSAGDTITDGSAYAEPDVADVIFNTLQTDTRWTGSIDGDSTGYNIAYKIRTPTIDQTFEVRITFTMTNGDTEVSVYQIDSK